HRSHVVFDLPATRPALGRAGDPGPGGLLDRERPGRGYSNRPFDGGPVLSVLPVLRETVPERKGGQRGSPALSPNPAEWNPPRGVGAELTVIPSVRTPLHQSCRTALFLKKCHSRFNRSKKLSYRVVSTHSRVIKTPGNQLPSMLPRINKL